MKLLTASLATLFASLSIVQATPTHQFDHFFPGWNDLVQGILRDNCSEPYAEYLTGHVNYTLGRQSLVVSNSSEFIFFLPWHLWRDIETPFRSHYHVQDTEVSSGFGILNDVKNGGS